LYYKNKREDRDRETKKMNIYKIRVTDGQQIVKATSFETDETTAHDIQSEMAERYSFNHKVELYKRGELISRCRGTQ
jgi:hypothetical protein